MLPREQIIKRMERITEALYTAYEFLATGKNGDSHYFRPLFTGRDRLPHRDWIKNVFIPRCLKAVARMEKRLEALERQAKDRRISRRRSMPVSASNYLEGG